MVNARPSFVFVVGAAASGKSAYAERLACAPALGVSTRPDASAPLPRVYVATLDPCDAESRARIERHRAQRASRGFATLEGPRGLAALDPALLRGASVLVDGLGVLVANELYDAAGALQDPAAVEESVVAGVLAARDACARLVAVSDEVFCAGSSYGEETLVYLRVLAAINRRLAACADAVAEVAAGCPNPLKGAPLLRGLWDAAPNPEAPPALPNPLAAPFPPASPAPEVLP